MENRNNFFGHRISFLTGLHYKFRGNYLLLAQRQIYILLNTFILVSLKQRIPQIQMSASYIDLLLEIYSEDNRSFKIISCNFLHKIFCYLKKTGNYHKLNI
jgi:hypothetical protein